MSGKRGDERPPIGSGKPGAREEQDGSRRGGIGQDAARGGSREKQEWIGRQLRSVYDEVVQEPIPDSLIELLAKLDTSKKDRS